MELTITETVVIKGVDTHFNWRAMCTFKDGINPWGFSGVGETRDQALNNLIRIMGDHIVASEKERLGEK
jgi:hypothetical protein